MNTKRIEYLVIPIILLCFYTSVWIVHIKNRDKVMLEDDKIPILEQKMEMLFEHWDELETELESKGRRELSKEEFLGVIKSINNHTAIYLKPIILNKSTVEICDHTIAFEVYTTSDPFLFPDDYHHHVLYGTDTDCPTVHHHKEPNVIKNVLIGKKMYYKISRHFWD